MSFILGTSDVTVISSWRGSSHGSLGTVGWSLESSQCLILLWPTFWLKREFTLEERSQEEWWQQERQERPCVSHLHECVGWSFQLVFQELETRTSTGPTFQVLLVTFILVSISFYRQGSWE